MCNLQSSTYLQPYWRRTALLDLQVCLVSTRPVMWLLPLLLLFGLPFEGRAQWECITNSGAITIIKYTGPGGFVTIPDTINDYPVISIGYAAFDSCISLTKITVPECLSYIGG